MVPAPVLIACCLLVQSSVASGSSSSGNKTASQTIHVVSFEYEAVKEPLIFCLLLLLVGLCKIGFHHADFLSSKIPESCLLIVVGTLIGFVVHWIDVYDDLPDLFNPHRFFIFLLPPIILESAFSLYDRTFSENLGTVLLFAVVGTILSCFLLGLSLYGLMKVGAMGSIEHITLVQIFVFSALIVAVDPVAVLAVFQEVGVNDVLYFIVFGESLLNDGVTVVLYKVMQAFNLMDDIPAEQIVLGIVKFVVVCFGGLLIGIIFGILTALLTRITVHVGVLQPLVIYTMAFLGFLLSELFEVSGIISIIGCGLVQRHYAYSNINHKSRTTVKYFTKVLATSSEIIIFFFLGLALVSDHVWHTGFVLWTVFLCTLYRFIITYSMAMLINRFDSMRVRLIRYEEMFMIAFGGLRGAVAFSLAALLSEKELPMKQMFVTTTLVVVMFTVFVQGITIKPLVNYLAIKLAPEKNTSMYCELNGHVTDHLMAGIEDVVGIHGKNHVRERLEQIDKDYFRVWLMNDPDPVDSTLQDFYTKIVVKEHYKNLKLCGASNVDQPENLPHIDTNAYLESMTSDKDSAMLADKVVDGETENNQDETVPAVRFRKQRPPRHTGSDLQDLRALLKMQRPTHGHLHNTFDRNMLDMNKNLQQELAQRSAHNRRLQHLLSTATSSTHPPLEHTVSWAEDDAQISQQRSPPASNSAPHQRAVSLDLGTQAAAFSEEQEDSTRL